MPDGGRGDQHILQTLLRVPSRHQWPVHIIRRRPWATSTFSPCKHQVLQHFSSREEELMFDRIARLCTATLIIAMAVPNALAQTSPQTTQPSTPKAATVTKTVTVTKTATKTVAKP